MTRTRGIRLVCEFLELSGLAEVVGASFGSIQKLTLQMQEEVAAFGTEQREVLAQSMASRSITVCEDETFHPRPCLVAIEPASNFILLEHYVERRAADDWNTAMAVALQSLPVEVIPSTSDQGTALALARRLRQAAEGYEKAVWIHNKHHGRGRPPDFAGRIERAQKAVEDAQRAVDEALSDQEACREAIRELSTDYHCYRLADGVAQTAEQVAVLIAAQFAVIDDVAKRAKLDKARRVSTDRVATIGFVHTEIAIRLAGLDISPELRTQIALKWAPGLYLLRVAARAKRAEDRRAITTTAELLLAPLRMPEHPLRGKRSPDHGGLIE